jgi:hypothetical protein
MKHTIKWLDRHANALDTLITLRVEFVKEFAEARERGECVPETYVYSLGELADRLGLPSTSFSRCCHYVVNKSDVDLTVATSLMAIAEHVGSLKTYAGFKFHNYRAKRLADCNKERDPTQLVARAAPVARRIGSTVPEFLEAVRVATKSPVSKQTVRSWCSNRRPAYVRDEYTFNSMLRMIESLRDDKEIETAPVRKRFVAAFRV